MKRVTKNYIVFIALFITALFQVVSGFVLWRVLPSGDGYQGGRGLAGDSSLIWSRHTWVDLHGWVAVGMLVVVVIHLILHWKWLVYVTKSYFKSD